MGPASAKGPSPPCLGSDSAGQVASSQGLTLESLGLGRRVDALNVLPELKLHVESPSRVDALNLLRL